MTSNDYIEKAKHALATDQPNLAMLYMTRGIRELDRRAHVHPYELMTLGFKRFNTSCGRLQYAIQDAFVQVHEEIARIREARVS